MSARLSVLLGLIRHVLARKKRLIFSLALIQIIFSASIIWGIPLIAGPGADAPRYLAAAWHLGLLCVGVAVAPQVMAEWNVDGYFDELRQLPVGRVLLVAAELGSWLLVGLPGLLVTPLLAWIGLDVTAANLGAAILILLCAALTYLGIGLILVLSMPLEAVQVISQVLMVVAMLFSPILYPAERLPDWAGNLHLFLPFEPLNVALLAAVKGDAYDTLVALRVIAWVLVMSIGSALVMSRRQHAARIVPPIMEGELSDDAVTG